MIASAPGPGPRPRRRQLWDALGYTAAAMVGALIIGTLLQLVGRLLLEVPRQVPGVVALVTAVIGSGLVPLSLPQSKWAIPQRWSRLGRTAYSALFGGILGMGVFTAASSIGLYALLAYGLVARNFETVWLVFLLFALGRTLPLSTVAAAVGSGRGASHKWLEHVTALAKLTFPAEIMLLAALGVLFLEPAWV